MNIFFLKKGINRCPMMTENYASITKVIGGSVLVCLKPKSVVAESDKSVGVKNLLVCVKQKDERSN